MELTFVKPDDNMKAEALAFRDAFYAAGEKVINGSGGLDFFPDFETWLQNTRDVESGVSEGIAPSATIRFARDAEGGGIVGIIDIRPALPEDKLRIGHIGYATLPGRRGQGIATGMVAWGVAQLRAAGVKDIYASVYAGNSASIKVLEKCGFLQKGMFKEDDAGEDIIQYVNPD